jgi:hypothetical protein
MPYLQVMGVVWQRGNFTYPTRIYAYFANTSNVISFFYVHLNSIKNDVAIEITIGHVIDHD